jgi:hypothetical protein
VLGRNLHEIHETNSILEIRLAIYSPVFDEIKATFFNVANFLSLRVVTLLILINSNSVLSAAQIQNKLLGCSL